MSAPITEQDSVVRAIIGQPWSIQAVRDSGDVYRHVKTVSVMARTKVSAASPQARRTRERTSAHRLTDARGHAGDHARAVPRLGREHHGPADSVDAVAHVGE